MFRPTERLLGEALRNTMVNMFISLVSGLIGETGLIKNTVSGISPSHISPK
jgi:hypothetical protein